MTDATATTDNTDPGGTLVLSADDRDHLIAELERVNEVLTLMLGVVDYHKTPEKREAWQFRFDANARLVRQLKDPTELIDNAIDKRSA